MACFGVCSIRSCQIISTLSKNECSLDADSNRIILILIVKYEIFYFFYKTVLKVFPPVLLKYKCRNCHKMLNLLKSFYIYKFIHFQIRRLNTFYCCRLYIFNQQYIKSPIKKTNFFSAKNINWDLFGNCKMKTTA